MRYSLFGDIMRRRLIVLCRIFGAICVSFEDRTYFSRNVDNKLPTYTSYISEERRPQLYFGGILWLSHNIILLSSLLHTLTSLPVDCLQLLSELAYRF